MDGLGVVQQETGTNVNLVRSQERNLVRNSGQYWKALGLLDEAQGKIHVSPFGQLLAEGKITQVEFATTVIKTLELPNKRIQSKTQDWDNIQLKIKPLELILDILADLSKRFGPQHEYITPFELRKIVVPLAGVKAILSDFADAIVQHRNNQINLSAWPDCAPESNDKRMVREFLLFLANYGFLKVDSSLPGNDNERYSLASISREEVVELHKISPAHGDLANVVRTIKQTQIPANVERKRVTREILDRPYQTIFRKNVLAAYKSCCLVTGVTIENVLEASHIIDVKYQGSDLIENGLCLRSDIHQLFDSRHLRILPNGAIQLSELASSMNNYSSLPKSVTIPDFVKLENLEWRNSYT